jgi:hypothetical protein
MVPVTDVRYVRDYILWLRFADGAEGEIDLEGALHGEVFLPLRDKKVFRSVRVHPEWDTIVWPNGTDLAPEFLHEMVLRGRKAPTGVRRGGAKAKRRKPNSACDNPRVGLRCIGPGNGPGSSSLA